MALGVRPRVLARRPLLLGGQVALLGIALGIPAGFAANAWLRSVMQSFFPLPVLKTPMQLGVFIQGAALGLVVSLLATVIPLRRALSVSPVEAISVGARAAKSSGLAWITRGIRLPGGSLANIPLRNVLRTPRRTTMTVLAIGAVVAITLALAGVIDSFNTTLDASRTEALAGSTQRLTVDLAAPEPTSAPALRAISDRRTVAAEQPSLRLPSTLTAHRRRLDAFLEIVARNQPLWHPTLSAGALPADRPGLVIAQRAAENLGVRIGDGLTVRYPVPTGPRSYQLVSATVPIGAFATIAGLVGGYAILRWIIDVSMRSTMPDLGILISISASTVGLAALAGILSVSAAPLLTLRRLRRTDVPSALRVVE